VKLGASILFLLAFLTNGFSQKLLFQKNRHREALYVEGDIISLRLKGKKRKYTDQIIGFQDSIVVFRNYRINPTEISHLYVDDKTKTWFIFRYKYKNVLPIAGAGYILLDLLNTGELKKETLVIGGTFIASGIIAKLLISERIKIKGRRKLVILR
jgi:hypothetical protein